MALAKSTLVKELDSAQELLAKWQGLLQRGVPGVDYEADDEKEEAFFSQMSSEFMLVASKLETIAGLLQQGS